MSGTDNNTQGQKPKVSVLAVASVLIAAVVLIGWSVLLIILILDDLFFEKSLLSSNFMLWLTSLVFAMTLWLILSPIFAIVALLRIKKRRELLKGKSFAIAGIVLSACGLIFLWFLYYYSINKRVY
ncbi:MAG: hypothetical protein ACYS0I_09005 [Planctomycetota bacterium]|jgi:hypothetical protein